MLPTGWQDRIIHKRDLSNWLDKTPPVFAISVNDSQEIEDIDEWLKGRFDGGLVARATFTSDSEILRYDLLQTLVYGLGEENFPTFIKQTKNLPKSNPFAISQSVGENAKAGHEIEYENISQNASIYLDGKLIQEHYFLERNIFPLLTAFSKDIQKVSNKSKVLFVIKFNKFYSGDKNAGSDFFIWFQEQFLNRISTLDNIKTCIIFQGNTDRLTRINEENKIQITTMTLQDILDATKEHLAHHEEFCNGMIDPDSNTIEYHVFKRKFFVRMRKLIQEIQND
jgi:hypothetical protein